MLEIKTNDLFQCGKYLVHRYDCHCDDYWGYCSDVKCNYFFCVKCDRVITDVTPAGSRPIRKDVGSTEEREILSKLLNAIKSK